MKRSRRDVIIVFAANNVMLVATLILGFFFIKVGLSTGWMVVTTLIYAALAIGWLLVIERFYIRFRRRKSD